MLYLKNATYIDYTTLQQKKTSIAIEEGIDNEISFIGKIPDNERNIVDCTGKYVTKSFVISHHHTYSALATGMPGPKIKPKNFHEILKSVWWTLDKCLDKEIIEASALVTAIKAAKAGITFIIDHHSSPNYIQGSLNIIGKAFERVGISNLLCYEVTDRNGQEKADQALQENIDYLRANQGLLGLHASFTISDNTMKKAAEIIEKQCAGVHIHVAEDKIDQEKCTSQYNKKVIERLNEHGLLKSSKSILAHCIHIDNNERNILRNSNAWIVQNPESNLKNKVGFFSSKNLGNRILLGTDGMHSDMLRSSKFAYFSGLKFDSHSPENIYRRLRNAHEYLKTNNFTGDGNNNLIVFDYNPHTELNPENFTGHFIFSLDSTHIQHVIANGKLIIKDKQLLAADESEIFKFSLEQSKRLWNKYLNS